MGLGGLWSATAWSSHQQRLWALGLNINLWLLILIGGHLLSGVAAP